jgi:hypothetical protein
MKRGSKTLRLLPVEPIQDDAKRHLDILVDVPACHWPLSLAAS